MRWVLRITEATTCALLSLGLTKIGVFFFDFTPDLIIPVSVFVSWIGTDQIRIALNKVFEKWLGSQDLKK